MTFSIRNPEADALARRILAKRGLAFPKDRKPIADGVYHNLDHDLTGPA